MEERIKEILELFQLEVESWNIGSPTHPTLTKEQAHQAILTAVAESEREAYKRGFIDGGIKGVTNDY